MNLNPVLEEGRCNTVSPTGQRDCLCCCQSQGTLERPIPEKVSHRLLVQVARIHVVRIL